MDQYRIFSRDGIWIEQVRTSAERAWALVTETSAKFALSIFDEKCNSFVLNYGNLLLIENSDGLLPWVGMIDDIGFDEGKCIVNAYTPERFFAYRRGPRLKILKGTAGELFVQMINWINGLEPTVLAVGDINSNTNIIEEVLNPVPLTNNLKRIVTRSGEGYRWRPEVVDGKLTIYADWYSSLTLETGLILQDGYNVSGNHPLSLAPPVNDYLAYGLGADWALRIMQSVQDDESIQDYGLRQASTSLNTKSVDTLKVTARTFLDAGKQPSPSFPISALNQDDTFAKLAPGALATFTKLVGQGFTDNETGYLSYDRIVKSMTYDPAQGDVALAV
jgi:hypothetical protein